MSDLVIPSRSTSTLLYGHWIGGVDPDWGGMIRSVAGAPVDVRIDATGREERLIGQLTHNLAGPLRNVTVIWVRGQRFPPRHYDVREGEEVPWVPKLRSGQMLNAGYMWASPEWGPGEVLDFADQRFNPVGTAVLSTSLTQRYIEEHRRSTATGAIGDLERRSALEMLSFFHQLTPPEYFKHRPEDTEPTHVYFHRRLGRELDLSTWFARPCLIVIGFLRDSDLPVPVRVGDSERKPRSDGLTVVRWIYPLPLLEEIAFPGPEEEPDAW